MVLRTKKKEKLFTVVPWCKKTKLTHNSNNRVEHILCLHSFFFTKETNVRVDDVNIAIVSAYI